MALHFSSVTTTTVVMAVPAKTQTSSATILRTPCVIGRRFLFSAVLELSPSSSSTILKSTPSQKYVYPDPNSEFAVSETRKFKDELLKKLSKDKETFGKDLGAVVDICVKIFSEFLHKEYGGPGTLLVEPFTYMFIALKDKKLPGAPVAARASLLWAQNYVDQDWEIWEGRHDFDRDAERFADPDLCLHRSSLIT